MTRIQLTIALCAIATTAPFAALAQPRSQPDTAGFTLHADPAQPTCPVANCPAIGSKGYGGAYGGPTLSSLWIHGQSTPDKHPQFLGNLGLYVKDDGTALGQYVTQYLGAMQGPGAGPTWSLNTDIVRGGCEGGPNTIGDEPGSGIPFGAPGCSAKPGSLGTASSIGFELDLSNFDADTARSHAFVTGLYIQTLSTYTATAGISIGKTEQSAPSWHHGIEFSPDTVADASIFDVSNAHYSLFTSGAHSGATIQDDATGPSTLRITATKSVADIDTISASPAALANSGTKSIATIVDASASPLVLSTSGNHATAVWSDTSSSPAALNATGHYAIAALRTEAATTETALVARAGQAICLAGAVTACMRYDVRTGALNISSNGKSLFSLDQAGNLLIRGRITQDAAP